MTHLGLGPKWGRKAVPLAPEGLQCPLLGPKGETGLKPGHSHCWLRRAIFFAASSLCSQDWDGDHLSFVTCYTLSLPRSSRNELSKIGQLFLHQAPLPIPPHPRSSWLHSHTSGQGEVAARGFSPTWLSALTPKLRLLGEQGACVSSLKPGPPLSFPDWPGEGWDGMGWDCRSAKVGGGGQTTGSPSEK